MRSAVLLAPLLVTVFLASASEPARAELTLVDRVVALVNGEPVLASEIDRAITLGQLEPSEGESTQEMRRRVLDELIDQRLRLQEVDRFGFDEVPVAQVDAQVSTMADRFDSRAAFEAALEAEDLDLDSLRFEVARQLEVMTYVDELLGARVFVGIEEITSYYQTVLVPELLDRGDAVPPLDEVREEIRFVLRQERLNEELARWTATLRSQSDVEDYFDQPERELPERVLEVEAGASGDPSDS